ncbi:MAG: hypothetical protein SWX82_34135 [Cyanobacteriota bacterium]|nr:hypothetical protein [Cyanobacteriota bacterium]
MAHTDYGTDTRIGQGVGEWGSGSHGLWHGYTDRSGSGGDGGSVGHTRGGDTPDAITRVSPCHRVPVSGVSSYGVGEWGKLYLYLSLLVCPNS